VTRELAAAPRTAAGLSIEKAAAEAAEAKNLRLLS
jgi:hypothetical protein